MNNLMRQSSNFQQQGLDGLVLEDSVEETETIVGHGQANILKAPNAKAATVDSCETRKSNKRRDHRQKSLTDCRQSKEVSEKSEVVLLSGRVEDTASCILRKGRQTETSFKGNDQELSLPPIFVSKISPKQELSSVQSSSVYVENVAKHNQKQDENVKLGKKVNEQHLDSFVDKPSIATKAKVNLRMKLEQIKTGVKQDQKKNCEAASVKVDTVKEKAEETTESVCAMTESEISDVEVNCPSTDKDFLQVKELNSVQQFQPLPLELEVAKDLKKLVLGSSSLTFQDEWKFQGFALTDRPKLQYGIIQKKSGPCAIFSVVQAFLLRHLLFVENLKLINQSLRPNGWKKAEAIATALATILWQAGHQKTAVVVILGKKAHLNPSSIRVDGITEKALVVTLDRFEDLVHFLTLNIDQYRCSSGPGLILSVYSAILSHTIQGVRENMDDPNGRLIESNGCCSQVMETSIASGTCELDVQELLNLFLTGNAVTDVFNNDQETSDGDGNKVIRRGIMSRSDIGLLSLSECQKQSSHEVGPYLKTPKYPIWVLQMENNFSVLFSPKKVILSDWKAEKKFDLYYYNCLNQQNDEIRLTIEDVVSPVDLCIRTKWNKAEIHWNGVEPFILHFH